MLVDAVFVHGVPVTLVHAMQETVVDVVAVRESDVAAPVAVSVLVCGMVDVRGRHGTLASRR